MQKLTGRVYNFYALQNESLQEKSFVGDTLKCFSRSYLQHPLIRTDSEMQALLSSYLTLLRRTQRLTGLKLSTTASLGRESSFESY